MIIVAGIVVCQYERCCLPIWIDERTWSMPWVLAVILDPSFLLLPLLFKAVVTRWSYRPSVNISLFKPATDAAKDIFSYSSPPTSVSTPYRSRVCTCNPQRDSNNGGLMGIVLDLNRERDNVGIVKPHPHHNDDDSPKKRSGPYWHKRHSHSPHTIVSSHTPPPSTILRPKSEVSRSTLLITNMNMGIISCRFASRSNECVRAGSGAYPLDGIV